MLVALTVRWPRIIHADRAYRLNPQYDDKLDVGDFRRLIAEEAASFRAEKALARRLRAEKIRAATLAGAEAEGGSDGPGGGGEDTEMQVEGAGGGSGGVGTAAASQLPAQQATLADPRAYVSSGGATVRENGR